MPRLFYALWPDGTARRALARLAAGLTQESGGKAVSAEKLHLTLAFLGSVDPGRVAAARRAGDAVRAEPFRLQLDRVGGFQRTRVGWAGCLETPPPLLRLQARLVQALADEGFATERRDFAPHLTLVRGIGERIREEPMPPVSWEVTAFALVESVLRGGGYATLAAWPVGLPKDSPARGV